MNATKSKVMTIPSHSSHDLYGATRILAVHVGDARQESDGRWFADVRSLDGRFVRHLTASSPEGLVNRVHVARRAGSII